jgi:YD repeat-containing protein
MLPVHDTTGIAEALVAGTYYSDVTPVASATSSDGTVTYRYDATGQLIGADYSGSPADESYAYDANGNRTNPGYVIGAGNRLVSDGEYRYLYDAEGNRIARFIDVDEDGVLDSGDTDITQYTWDNRNRLVQVTDRATFGGDAVQIVTYLYDLENRWIGKTVDSDGDGTVDYQTWFAYDGNQIVLEFDKDGTGNVTGQDLSHRYLWGPAVDQALADEQSVRWPTTWARSAIWPCMMPKPASRALPIIACTTALATSSRRPTPPLISCSHSRGGRSIRTPVCRTTSTAGTTHPPPAGSARTPSVSTPGTPT